MSGEKTHGSPVWATSAIRTSSRPRPTWRRRNGRGQVHPQPPAESPRAGTRLVNLRNRAATLLVQVDRGIRTRSSGSGPPGHDRFPRAPRCGLLPRDLVHWPDIPVNLQANPRMRTRSAGHLANPGQATPGRSRRFLRRWGQGATEIVEACYELSWFLAEAVAATAAREDPTVQADRGLGILDQAGPPALRATRAYHSRRAACLPAGRQDGRGTRARRSPSPSGPPRPTSTSGRHEKYKRGSWFAGPGGIHSVLRLEPGDFWAQCLSAICSLKTEQPGTATIRTHMSASSSRPEFVWLYLLRAHAAGRARLLP